MFSMPLVMTDGGSIMTIPSLTARLPGPGLAVYAAARPGIDYAIKIAAVEYGGGNIRNSIAAGLIRTVMTDAIFGLAILRGVLSRTSPRAGWVLLTTLPDALWLADDARSGFINGQLMMYPETAQRATATVRSLASSES